MAHFSREDVRCGLMASAKVRGHTRAINMAKPTVMHLTLAFPPAASQEPRFVRTAVREALQALESHQDRTLADHQYAAFLHHDTEHWHIHIVINMVDHRTGRLADPYRSRQKLQSWAHDWCKRHGFDVCKDRQKKYNQIAEKNKSSAQQKIIGLDQDCYQDMNGLPYHLYKNKRPIDKYRVLDKEYACNADTIKQRTTARYAARKTEKQELYEWYDRERKRIRAHFNPLIQKALIIRKNPIPFSLDARQKRQRHAFFRQERSLTGRLINTLALTADAFRKDAPTAFIKAFMHYLTNSAARRSTFFRQQYTERRNLPRVKKIVEKQAVYLARLEQTYIKRKEIIHARHRQEITEERRLWAVINKKRSYTHIEEKTICVPSRPKQEKAPTEGQTAPQLKACKPRTISHRI